MLVRRSTRAPQMYAGTFTMSRRRRSHGRDGVPLRRRSSAKTPRRPTPSASTTCTSTIRSSSQKPEDEAAADPQRAGQPGRLLPAPAQDRDGQEPERRVVGAARCEQGRSVASGTTKPFGKDAGVGRQGLVIDFSSFTGAGQGLHAEGRQRREPPVRHPQRHLQQAEVRRARVLLPAAQRHRDRDAVRRRARSWTRPAGHVGVPPNHGDKAVPCLPGCGCDYTLDVTGGWYDAGDHGKYVVNGGISVWTLLNWYERTQAPRRAAADFARRQDEHPREQEQACPTSSTRRAGSWSSS